ncbi:MAG: 1-deoxy-D-xylulose-5-phosphate reductoisomerase [Ruminococcus sp.]|nr:1-deoxy-D-xylulose-5-phosphate reductoisomerase [Ruminococcus sp.]
MTESMSILGSTGSIGTQTLDVAEKYNIKICALTAHRNVKLMEEQVRKFSPELAVMSEESAAEDLRVRLADTGTKVLSGMEGLIEAASLDSSQVVLNSLVGMVGLEPTLAACKAKKTIALANKETLVAGGELVMNTVKDNGVALLPVDSEHSAIFQCLQECPDSKMIKKLILTASGGPFFGKSKEELQGVTVEQALAHPNWSMGAKITVDSASMMNKGLEIIEARWLFDVLADDIDVVVHRQSIIHSMVEFTDNSVLAQMSEPDMRIPIQYALTYPERVPSPVKELDLTSIGTFTFHKPDYETFECLNACKLALKIGGTSPAIANGANEVANLFFREGKIPFLRIGELVTGAVNDIPSKPISNLKDVLEADAMARDYVSSLVS